MTPELYNGRPFESETLMGFMSPPGHEHNDNCLKRNYLCVNGHSVVVSLLRRCATEGCDWVGKRECFCHSGAKVEEWP